MSKKENNVNAGKIMVICGAVVILVLVALWCSSLLKMTQKDQNETSELSSQNTMSVNVIVPPSTTTTTTATTTTETSTQTTTVTNITDSVTGTLTVNNNGEFNEYVLKLANSALDVYSEPSYNSMIAYTITDRGSYVIIKETVDDDGNKWGLLEDNSGWINLLDARKSDSDDTYENSDSENISDSVEDNNYDYSDSNNDSTTGFFPGSNLTGVDADGDGWDDGFNPDAWCPYCGYDSYYNSADGNYYCSQGHIF